MARTVAWMTSPVRPRSTGPSTKPVTRSPCSSSAAVTASASRVSVSDRALPEEGLDRDGGVAQRPADRPTALVPDESVDALGPEPLVHGAQPLGDDRVAHRVRDVGQGPVTEGAAEAGAGAVELRHRRRGVLAGAVGHLHRRVLDDHRLAQERHPVPAGRQGVVGRPAVLEHEAEGAGRHLDHRGRDDHPREDREDRHEEHDEDHGGGGAHDRLRPVAASVVTEPVAGVVERMAGLLSPPDRPGGSSGRSPGR